ncbi:transcription termination factor MTERF5, chloroplastic-like isoform X2 [Magnolia sinica]|uniref:transcription termination factor MTERF5, chloroplastic-like isoform X2 n=1 Tax=Magnolia sinica TaxID=86752 RepID=UPI002659062F|nr:transcription termination factor MTERF5, chloroplastic-like isoform X2 [Magnolia sinica]
MFHFLRYRKLLQINIQTLQIQSLQNPFLKSYSKTNPPFSLLQYLQSSCALSPEKALTASKAVYHRTPKDPDSILKFLKSYGFPKTHIESIITNAPQLLFTTESSLRPKIQFFKEKGLSESDIVSIIISDPAILTASLENRIKPWFDFLSNVFGTHKLVIKSLKRSKFRFSSEKAVVPNVAILKNCGVSDHQISKLLMGQPLTLIVKSDRFNEIVKMVQEMGFNPSTYMFVEAVRVIAALSRPMWYTKFEVYRSLGCSNEEILLAFRKRPGCIAISEEKIRSCMNFFVKELGWNPSSILVYYPNLLSLSLEKRIVPRHRFWQFLVSKGLIKKDGKFVKIFMVASEKRFLENYVMKHQAKVPEILKIYEGMIGSKIIVQARGKACSFQNSHCIEWKLSHFMMKNNSKDTLDG